MKVYRKLVLSIETGEVLQEDSYQYSGPVAQSAAGTWKIYAKAKKYIGAGTITLGAGVFKMQLHRASASAAILVLSTRSTSASIPGEITATPGATATGGYAAGGRQLVPATAQWTVGASAKQYKFTYTTAGLVFTASGGNLNNIKYALIKNSAGKLVCFCTLSSTPFTISSPNTLTVLPAATGVFTLA